MNQSNRSPNHIHLIGIGGSGMSGLAEVLHNLGYVVSGSDISLTSVTRRLTELGIKVENNHNPLNVRSVDMVVLSSAIDESNEELQEAKKLLLPVLSRAELLSSLMNMKRGIAVAGTHGKTTTTSLLASIMTEAMLDPTFIIGGVINSFSTNAKLGRGNYLIAEVDESDKSFLLLQPSLIIITNIDDDHLVNYDNNIRNLELAFVDFVKKLPFNGLAIVCGDDPIIKRLIPSFTRQIITYGFDESNDYVIEDYVPKKLTSEFSIKDKEAVDFKVKLNLTGRHNALNALSASILAIEEGVSILNIQSALERFSGIGRRMQFLGEIYKNGKKNIVIDDYGHHPTEIKKTIEAIRESFPEKKVSMVFQPHRFSRTKDLFKKFIDVLQMADDLILLPIYSAGEEELKGITSDSLMEEIKKKGFEKVKLAHSNSDLFNILNEQFVQEERILLMQGAGDISDITRKTMEEFS